jgi:protocatechuate 3,4-dioxygenase beta subunit
VSIAAETSVPPQVPVAAGAPPAPEPPAALPAPNAVPVVAASAQTRPLMLADTKGAYGVHGQVYLPDGEPAAGVEVALRFLAQTEESGPLPAGILRTNTDAQGQYRFESLPPGRYGLLARAEGLLAVAQGSPTRALPDYRATLALEAGLPLGGRVVDAAGAPVAGAVVGPRINNGNRLPRMEQVMLQVETDADGHFFFGALRPHAWQLYCNAGAQGVLLSESMATGTTDAELTVQPGLTLAGRVVDDATGEPLADVVVAARGGQDAQDAPEAPVRTDASGAFVYPALLPGEYALSLQDAVYVLPEYERKQGLQAGHAEGLELRAVRSGAVEGRAVDAATGQPLPYRRIAFSATGVQGRLPVAVADGEGRFALAGLPPGQYGANASSMSDDAPAASQVDVPSGGVARGDVPLPAEQFLAVRVVDVEGRAVPQADVNWTRLSPRKFTIRQTTNHDGSLYLFDGDAGEAVELAAALDGAMSAVTGPMPLAAALQQAPITLVLSKPVDCLVAGVAVDAAGRAVNAEVTLALEEGRLPMETSAKTDYQGRFLLRRLPAGTYHATVRPENGQAQQLQTLTLQPGQAVRDLRLALGRGEALGISGVVTDEAGKPLAARVSISDYEPRGMYPEFARVETDGSGRFSFANLEAGEYRLRAEAAGHGMVQAFAVAAGEQEVALVCPAASMISGRVLDPAGKAVTQFEIAVLSEMDPREPEERHYKQVKDGAGRFSVEARGEAVIPEAFLEGPMPYTVFIRAEGYAVTSRMTEEGVPVGTSVEAFDIIVKPKRVLRGVVLDSGGRPVEGAKILKGQAVPEGQLAVGRAVATTDAAGRFTYEPPAERRVWLWAFHGSLGTGQVDVMEDDGDDVEIRLEKTGTVRGRFVGELSQLQHVHASLSGAGVTPEEDGSFVMRQVPSGTVTVEAGYQFGPEEYAQDQVEVVLEPGGEVEVEFIVPTEGKPVEEPLPAAESV